MAKKSKNASGAASTLTLAAIVAATQESGFLFATREAAAPFVADGTAETNDGVTNPDNPAEIAVRATAEGITKNMDAQTNTNANTSAPANDKPTFQRFSVKAAELPVLKRGGGGQTLYPFDELKAPSEMPSGEFDAFFVPATDKKPKPWESLQSAVSAATRRYATKTGEKEYKKADGSMGMRAVYDYTRKFKLSEFTKADGTKGAVISRVQ